MNSNELKKRTKQFALQVMRFVDLLPRTTTGKVIGGQLVRAGTSVGANYRAACRGRSKAEFAAKIGTVAEEAEADYETHLIKYLLDDTPTINNDPLSARREDEQEARILKTFFDTLYRREVEAGAREYAALVQRYASWN